MNINYLKVIIAATAVVLCSGILVYAEQTVEQTVGMRRVSGEIGWVDVQQGQLDLNNEKPEGSTTTYKINKNETRVTDSRDKEFLTVGDLRAGQYVTLEMVYNEADKTIKKIIVKPMPPSEFQLAFGELREIDVSEGTFVVEERIRIGQEERSRLSYFVFDPKEIVVMHSPSREPVELMLKPGDIVKVKFVARDKKQYARFITLYSPAVISTTTTTTVTTTR